MNAPFIVAQANTAGTDAASTQRVIRVVKPQGDQAISVRLDGAARLDLSEIGNEKVTFVRVGERLVILFDNQATVGVEGFFDANGQPSQNLSFQVDGNRVINSSEFATLFPITTDQSILPAAGNAGAGPTSGANFRDVQVEGLGSRNSLDLLAGEGGDGAGGQGGDAPTNTRPSIGTIALGNADDEGLSEGNIGGPGDEPGNATSITVSLNVDFGQDLTGRTLTFGATQPSLVGLTSGGAAISIAFTTIGGLPALIGYTGADANDPTHQVFTVTLDTGPLNGQYTFTLLQPLDHPIAGTEDTITLSINFTATDGNGDAADGTFQVAVNDDSPEAGVGTASVVEDEAVNGGNNEIEEPNNILGSVEHVSLNISWGADRANSNSGQPGDRSVAFTDNNVAVTGAHGEALTSLGQTVSFVVLSNGELIGYTGESAPESSNSENVVFVATLSDANNGEYNFTLLKPLDHADDTGNGENTLTLTFNYTATDSDGDPSASTFQINVVDDVPVAGVGTASIVEDEAVNSGNNETEAPNLLGAVSNVSLNIAWGSDNANDGNGQPGDRSVAFTNNSVVVLGAHGEALTSLGQTVSFIVLSSGELVGYTGDAPTTVSAENVVLVATLSDANNGEYNFTLLKPLDHADDAGNGENALSLTFNYTATDSDGDTSSNTFKVDVVDDIPIAGVGTPATVEDEAVNNGNNEADGYAASIDHVSLNIAWGSDNANDGNGQPGDRSVAFTNDTVAVTGAHGAALTSLGQTVSFIVLSSGELVGYTGDAPESSSAGNVVFVATLSDANNGEYSFTLLKPLDHADDDADSENTLSLTFNYTATDS
ncbi:MAG: hypothetical protein JWN71_3437, partial [Xanthobacteraceae bacterium]|nr:hypothetical protein [Xanthobacteraceae bacterium]